MIVDDRNEPDSLDNDAETLATDVDAFLRRNFPQIAMHGGSATIQDVDTETGAVWIQLSGTCGDCGISPLTARAIRTRLPKEIDEIRNVHVKTT